MASHWYSKETGQPKYRIVGANGKERDTTLRDARKHGYVPSVTTILQIPSKPMLDVWKQDQLLEAVLKHGTGLASKDIKQWKGMIVQESQQIGKDTAERGSQIHDDLEKFFTTGGVGNKWTDPVINVILAIRPHGWIAEESFAHELGFGGRVDLYHPDGIIIDFKTKFSDGEKFAKIRGYDENLMQLAAYDMGLPNVPIDGNQLINIYISTLTPGLIYVKVWSDDEAERGWKMFRCLLDYWKLMNRIE